jgi:hypothetical protein
MQNIVKYNECRAFITLEASLVRGSNPTYLYSVEFIDTKHGNAIMFPQLEYLIGNSEFKLSQPASTEQEARQLAYDKIISIIDEFNTWPQYRDHAYLPGETYDGDETPTAPGENPWDQDEDIQHEDADEPTEEEMSK